ncbi:MAG: sulfatase [Candidatus Solibacter usitatus]|nr:sulfatase [Candidatus Solibacter usitatus]
MTRREFAYLALVRRPPNIIFILADDLGWGELGCYGNTFNQTPNLDRLAAEGMRFHNAYSAAPVCSPTRASIMTGQHPARVGITDFLRADDPNHLRPSLPSLPKMLKKAGYRTGLIGKWHLMGDYAKRPGDPKLHGFDEVICSETSYIGPGYYWHPYKHLQGLEARAPNEYLTDRLNQEAVDFIARSTQPFFLYLAHYAPHTRLEGKPDLVAKYKNRPGASQRKNNPVLAAMLESIDDGVGMILRELARRNLDNDTIVIFNSDNGGELNVTTNAHLRSGKSHLYEGGIRVPLIARWPGVIPRGATCATPVVSTDYYATFLDLSKVSVTRTDGRSLAPLLRNPAAKWKARDLYWYYPLEKDHALGGKSSMAIRDARWKLIEFLQTGERQLFDLAGDPSETRDVAARNPAVVRTLAARLARWRKAQPRV